MSDTDSFSRQWLLLRRLCARGANCTVRELAQDAAVSSKTIQRDLQVLRGVGFPIEERVGYRGQKTWHCGHDGILTGLAFTFDEAAALYLGQRFLEPLAGTWLWEAARRAFHKIRSGLPAETGQYLDQVELTFYQTSHRTSDYTDRAALIDSLMTAIEDARETSLLYQSQQSQTPAEVLLHPYGLIYHRGSLYLVANVPDYGEIRHYKLDRARDVCLLDHKFERDPTFKLARHLESSFGVYQGGNATHAIRIRFHADAACYVQEHFWHASQRFTDFDDGGVLLELELSRLEEIKSWVLGFGAKAEVEEPEELRQMIADDVERLARTYRTATAGGRK